jgi:hypothetical protein
MRYSESIPLQDARFESVFTMKITLWIALLACLPLGAAQPVTPSLQRQKLRLKQAVSPNAAGQRNADSCPVRDLQPGTPVTQVITTEDCKVADIVPGEAFTTFAQLFKLEAPASSAVTVEMSSSEFDTFVALLDINFRVLASNDDIAPGNTNSRVLATLKRGTYFVLATTALAGAGGGFTLQANIGSIPSCTTSDLPLGDSNGALTANTCLVEYLLPPSADARFGDGYVVTVTQPSVVTVQLQSAEFRTFLQLYDSASKKIAEGANSTDRKTSLLVASVVPGKYLLVASSFGENETGAYSLRASLADPQPCPRTDLAFSGVRSDSLAATCRVLDIRVPGLDAALAKPYRLQVTTPGVVDIRMGSGTLFSSLILLDSNKKLIATNDADQTGVAEIALSVPVGEYTVIATTADLEGPGSYQIAAQFVRAKACVTADFPVPGSLNGSLSSSDCGNWDAIPFYQYGDLTKLYRIQVPRRAIITLDLTSTQLDPYLILIGDDKRDIAEDDNGGGGFNARITVQLNPGTYFVLATTSGTGPQTGNFTLRSAISDPPACPTAELSLNSAITDEITTSDCRVRELTVEEPASVVAKQYTVTITQDGTLTLDMGAKTFQPALLLYDPQGKRLALDTLPTPGVVEVAAPVTAGVYTAVVTGRIGETGAFVLRSSFE